MFSSLQSGEEEARACEEEGADSQSKDLRAQCEEEGMTEECEEEERLEDGKEEVEALDPRSDS